MQQRSKETVERSWPALPEAMTILNAGVVVVTLLLILAPVGTIFYGSLRTDAPGSPDAGFTFANWVKVYSAPDYLAALLNTMLLAATVAMLSVLVGGLMAWIIARTDAPGRHVLARLVVLPLMISTLVTTLAWIAIAAPNAGFINAWTRGLTGIKTLFDIYSFSGIVLVLVLHYASFAFLALFAALRAIDGALEEASAMSGAGPLHTTLHLTLPLIWPSTASTLIAIFVLVAENFSVPALLGTPVGFDTLSARIFTDMAVTPARPTQAATAGTMLLWLALAASLWQRRLAGASGRYATVGGKGGGRSRLAELGRWRYLASGFVVLFVVTAVVLPYLALVLGSLMKFLTPNLKLSLFTLENYASVLDGDNWLAVENSLLLSAPGGLGIVLAYVLLAHIVRTSRGAMSVLVDLVTVIPTALPALVLGVGLVWAFVGSALPIYGTMAILLIAYFVRYIRIGVQHALNAFGQLGGDLGEAARVCGASRFQALRDIEAPIIQPSIMTLWTLMFIFIFMEISATILLYSPSTATLPTVLWNDMASGFQTRAFAVAVVQATLIFVILALTDWKFGTLKATLERP